MQSDQEYGYSGGDSEEHRDGGDIRVDDEDDNDGDEDDDDEDDEDDYFEAEHGSGSCKGLCLVYFYVEVGCY